MARLASQQYGQGAALRGQAFLQWRQGLFGLGQGGFLRGDIGLTELTQFRLPARELQRLARVLGGQARGRDLPGQGRLLEGRGRDIGDQAGARRLVLQRAASAWALAASV